ncbi:endophilin-B1 isoform X2 [Lingula anatina]|uniref:Endophilin-B1 isoform X2 n=1 Tax=Lingula anatina TaxID=7574 RepID=A0A1S3IQH3_LINAN|nr:endophilin-B1 isoform X2 [Lingula anatina]|eukprot:XP_013400161.1 endophilin-B1 isoform X2 [Lingula anatina]
MDFKKLAADASTVFNRAVQFTEEKFGHAEKTELDAHFENLMQRADTTRINTEKILGATESVLQPNPNARVEDFLYDKLDRKKRERQNNLERLGQFMVDAGNDFGPGTSYGNSLVKCGQTQQRLGQAEKDFVSTSANNFLTPLKNFLEGDMKTIQKERKLLETKRLDLDAAKSRVRKARSQAAQQQPGLIESCFPPVPPLRKSPEREELDHRISVEQAETDLRNAQSEFDRQSEITKLLLEGISSTHAHHLRCLNDFIEAQTTYYAQCQQYMQDLQRQLGSYSTSPNNPQGGLPTDIRPPAYESFPQPSAPPAGNGAPSGARKAKALYDYDAAGSKELSLLADEVITVYSVPGMDPDWMMGERGSQRGMVPVTYLEFVD